MPAARGQFATRPPRARRAEGAQLPEPFTGSVIEKAFTVNDVPTVEALRDTLEQWGLNTKDWGAGNTKDVSKFWKEINGSEAGLEVWKRTDGTTAAVRVTHVLRAKVSSPDAHSRNIFLFNTWQQYGDGRRRIRNGLLSEKLTLEEMPLSQNLHAVCQRAVTEEEMQRIVDSSVRIGPQRPAPEYDPGYRCPLNVVHSEFVDHTIEIEPSKSYPGLLTVYHLYTVDIVCEGLPAVDFNTLEFEAPCQDGKRKLKYIHAWVWLEWQTIQRYLFDGSELKERKSKGSFKSAKELEAWLGQFDIDIESWGTSTWKSVQRLWMELEGSQTQLERWGRNDGVPLLMRVVHVLQLKVTSMEAAANQKFLFQVWQQGADGQIRDVNRTMARKLCTADLPFDAQKFEAAAKTVVNEQLSYLADVHARLSKGDLPTKHNSDSSGVKVVKVEFSDHRFDLEDSPSFKDMTTMYHLYTVEVVCEGLPSSDFASISFDGNGVPSAIGWKWVTWQETLDILHQRAQLFERREAVLSDKIAAASEACRACLEELGSSSGKAADDIGKASRLAQQLQDVLSILNHAEPNDANSPHSSSAPRYARIPPSMVANLADRKGVSDDFLDGALLARQRQLRSVVANRSEEDDTPPAAEIQTRVEEFSRSGCRPRCQPTFCGFFCSNPTISESAMEFRK
mmetsp:Transcript_61573/g.177203  ORF Transcript_61573/g.177203 Transcript_61573/m.177203 type:complete len:678 (-) Transcript_61573:52-2085(-)